MLRAMSLAIGITLCCLGLECMAVETFVLVSSPTEDTTPTASLLNGDQPETATREYSPPEWMPWSLMSAGTVIILYSFTIPRRVAS